MSSYPLAERDDRKRRGASAQTSHWDGFDSELSVRFVHRLRFTSASLDPQNPVLADLIRNGDNVPAKVLVFVDDGVLRAADDVPNKLVAYAEAHPDVMELAGPLIEVPGGEQCKNDPSLVDTFQAAIDRAGLCRQSYVIVIGGGAVLDVVGFAAGIAHRGVRLIRLPTTTLSQSDSGVGVKNGVNTFDKKNFTGSFAVPWAVINDRDHLVTLSERDWRCGFSEAVKVALIKDRRLFDTIVGAMDGIGRRDLAVGVPILQRSAELHTRHITEGGDPFEMTAARPLDFGHWSAHKLERMTDFELRHGEAVAIGLALDVVYCALTERLSWQSTEAVLGCLEALGFRLYHEALQQTDTLLLGIEEFRQHLGGQLTITLIEEIGRSCEVHEMETDKIVAGIEYLSRRASHLAG